MAGMAGLTFEDEWQLMSRAGAVRLTAGDLGTEIKWVVTSPCICSLFAAKTMLADAQGPYVLRFFAAGWFEESHDKIADVRARVGELVMHGDRHIVNRVFERPSLPDDVRTPDVVRQTMRDMRPPTEHAVECRYDPELDDFVVCRIGERSAIGRIWGTDPTSHPCQTTGAFGSSTSSAYRRALAADLPIYEEVIAALRFPDRVLRWVPYHRVILPMVTRSSGQAVAVVSECAEVSFRVL
jgi:hypothetical protein